MQLLLQEILHIIVPVISPTKTAISYLQTSVFSTLKPSVIIRWIPSHGPFLDVNRLVCQQTCMSPVAIKDIKTIFVNGWNLTNKDD